MPFQCSYERINELKLTTSPVRFHHGAPQNIAPGARLTIVPGFLDCRVDMEWRLLRPDMTVLAANGGHWAGEALTGWVLGKSAGIEGMLRRFLADGVANDSCQLGVAGSFS